MIDKRYGLVCVLAPLPDDFRSSDGIPAEWTKDIPDSAIYNAERVTPLGSDIGFELRTFALAFERKIERDGWPNNKDANDG